MMYSSLADAAPTHNKFNQISPMSQNRIESAQSEDLEENEHDPPLPLTEHLSELRKRLINAVSVIFVGLVIGTYLEVNYGQPILKIIRQPLDARGIPLVFDELTEPFFTYLRIGLYSSLFLTFPWTLGQIWLFIKPALYPKERRYFWPFLFISFPLFIGGGSFGYFVVMPFGYDFFLDFMNSSTLPSLRMGDYLTLSIRLLFAFGLIFELPLICLFLTRLEVIDSSWLKQNRKFAIVGIMIVSAILTPPDVITQLLMAGPLLVLYEIGIMVSYIAENRKQRESSDENNPDQAPDADQSPG